MEYFGSHSSSVFCLHDGPIRGDQRRDCNSFGNLETLAMIGQWNSSLNYHWSIPLTRRVCRQQRDFPCDPDTKSPPGGTETSDFSINLE